MTPALTFFVGLSMLVLFGWYFATDQGPRKRLLATTLMLLLVIFSIATMWPPQKKIALGLDIQGGTSFLIRLKSGDKPITKGMLDQAVEVIRKRVDYFGGGEPIISPVGGDRILVQIPGLDTAKIQEARDQLSRVAKLEFRLVYPDNGQKLKAIDEGKDVIPPEFRIESYKMQREGEKPVEGRLVIKKKADLSGDRVSSAGASYEKDGWVVHLRFDPEGAKKFGDITAAHVHHRFAIVLDGVIQSAPVIQDAIYGGDAQITGRFTEEEARSLASVLENPLQTPVSIEEERSVSPTLGLDSIRASILAGLLGLAITLVCVAIYYKIPGLIANLALLINLILLVGALTMFHFVLTLPGIAGIILTIGLSVDANVLVFERLREEMALGKSLKIALNTAYEKAFTSIFDANVTTLITAAILFWQATGPVRGFAISLTLGILASLFTALIVGRNTLGWFVDTGRLKRISMLHLISAQNINFLGKGFIACMCSLALLLAGATAFYLRGERNFGVDFRGGDLITLLYTAQLRAISQDPWFSRVQSPAFADHAALDLDPSDGVSFAKVLDVARWIRDELQTLGAPGVPKTSGASGLHIYVPLPPRTPYDAGLLFCQIVATVIAQKHPRVATIERSVAARGKRVYVDYMQNGLGQPFVARQEGIALLRVGPVGGRRRLDAAGEWLPVVIEVAIRSLNEERIRFHRSEPRPQPELAETVDILVTHVSRLVPRLRIECERRIPEDSEHRHPTRVIPRAGCDRAARTDDPTHLTDARIGIRHEVDHQLGESDIECVVRPRQRLGGANLDVRSRNTLRAGGSERGQLGRKREG